MKPALHFFLFLGVAAVAAETPNDSKPLPAGQQALSIHIPFDTGDCSLCHQRNDAANPGPLTQPGNASCLECHEEFKAILSRKVVHGAVEAGCEGCHNPHNSRQKKLLTKEYPEALYSPYDAKRYALCFDCHEESAFDSPETDKATQFRDGNRNLHYVHVHQDEMGRTCRVCHEVHASSQPHLIRDSIRYGSSGWTLKINYTKTPTGGACVKTCHVAMSYTNASSSSPALPKEKQP